MISNILRGKLVRLTSEEPQVLAEAFNCWNRDSEYFRLLAADPYNAYSVKKITQWMQRGIDQEPPSETSFAIRAIEGDQMVGFTSLGGDIFPHGEAFVGIGLGNREFWGKGYGTDAMKVILRYAFQELNLRRVSLDTFEYNPRAVRSYEKAGFVHEGRARSFLNREGQHWDLLFMGILREEWAAQESA